MIGTNTARGSPTTAKANGAASAIDKLNIPEMLGTLAGDDTCFVVLKDTQAAAEQGVTFPADVMREVKQTFNEIAAPKP